MLQVKAARCAVTAIYLAAIMPQMDPGGEVKNLIYYRPRIPFSGDVTILQPGRIVEKQGDQIGKGWAQGWEHCYSINIGLGQVPGTSLAFGVAGIWAVALAWWCWGTSSSLFWLKSVQIWSRHMLDALCRRLWFLKSWICPLWSCSQSKAAPWGGAHREVWGCPGL